MQAETLLMDIFCRKSNRTHSVPMVPQRLLLKEALSTDVMASLLGQSNIDWLTTSFQYAESSILNRPWNMAAVVPDNYISPVTEEDWANQPVTENQKSSN
jgi:hypothetical protein